MIKGAQLVVTVAGIDDEGAGVATLADGGGPIRVGFTLPGERARVAIEHVSPHGGGAWARLLTVEEAAPDRVAAACRSWGRCGGCVLQHWRYESQLTWKRDRLATALAGLDVAVAPCVPSPRPLGYRNRSKLTFHHEAGARVVLGAYAPRSHAVVDLAGCAIAEPPLDEVAQTIATLAGELVARGAIDCYDEASGAGVLRHALLRVNWRGEVQVLLVVARAGSPSVAELAQRLAVARPEVRSVVENLHAGRGNALVGRERDDVILVGEAALEERIGAARLRVSPRAFLQANRGTAALLYAAVADALALDGSQRVLDVYAGVGAISLGLAPWAREVVGIEEVPAAVDDARAAAAISGVPHARFLAGDAARILSAMARGDATARVDALVVNPPRKGLAPSVIEAAHALAPRTVAYVSCDPDTLARDLTKLVALGFRLRSATPFDMLPHTPHVEALVVLDRG